MLLQYPEGRLEDPTPPVEEVETNMHRIQIRWGREFQ